MKNIIANLQKSYWSYILAWFVLTRIILGFVGASSNAVFKPILGDRNTWHFSNVAFLNIWGKWDTTWYLGIAQNGYSANIDVLPNLAFFPLYPLFIKILALLTQNYYISALLISNFALLGSAFFIYKIIKLYTSDEFAKKSIIYLFLFPSSFILSGVFAESLFLLLSSMALYYGLKNRWWLAGVCGLLLSLTKSFGILITIPLVILYLQNIKFKIKDIKLDALHILLPTFGLLLFIFYCYFFTGNPLAFFTAQSKGWNNANFMDPISATFFGLFDGNIIHFFNTFFTLLIITLIIYFYKKTGLAITIFGVFSLTLYLSSGGGYNSMFRYACGILPVYLAFAFLEEKYPKTKPYTLYILISLQSFLMALWSIGITIIV